MVIIILTFQYKETLILGKQEYLIKTKWVYIPRESLLQRQFSVISQRKVSQPLSILDKHKGEIS